MLTVRHLADSFEAHLSTLVKTRQLRAATGKWYGPPLDKLRAAAGDFPADALRAHHLVAVEFTNAFVRALKTLYKWAADEDLIPRDPFGKLKTPPCGERSRVLAPPEFRRLLRSSPPAFRLYLWCQSRTITRPGELRGVRWRQVDLDRRVITLTEFKAKDKRRDGVKVRAIPLDLVVAARLARMRRKLGDRFDPAAFVFLSDRGGRPWSSNGLRCAMRRARTRAGLDAAGDDAERVVCYTLRHTGATDATRRGLRDAPLAAIMGHTDPSMTRRYQHLDGSDLVEQLDRSRRPSA